jgi:muramidase (phage lysozyme)
MPFTKADQLGPGGAAIAAFLDLIAWSEGTSTSRITKNDGYDVIVSGVDGPHSFTDYSAHPFADGTPAIVVRTGPPVLRSSASGRYQIIISTWRSLATLLKLEDFTAASQDTAAVKLLAWRGALLEIEAGNIEAAISSCAETWASFPGNLYGQGGKMAEELLQKYTEFFQQLG